MALVSERSSRAGDPRRVVRLALAERLRDRWVDVEQAIIARVYSISDPSYTQDAAYIEGLRSTVAVALDFGLATIAGEEGEEPPLPGALLRQARLAAASGVGLDTVMRRYVAGYTLLSDFVMREAEEGFPGVEAVHVVVQAQAHALDRVLAAVIAEYTKLSADRSDSSVERRAECVKRLLACEQADASMLAYWLEAWHVGVLAHGAEAEPVVRELAGVLDRRVLLVPGEATGTTWAWLGGSKRPSQPILDAARNCMRPGVTLAFGEPARGLEGWRLTHRQAAAALAVASRSGVSEVRYGDVALLSSLLKDELLALSLREIYLAPLVSERDGGKALFETLRAYFAAGRNVSSAAVALGVKRHTVTNRLRTIEERIGRPLSSCATDIEIALRLEDLGCHTPASAPLPHH